VNIGQEVLEELKNEITEVEYNRYIKHLTYDIKKSTSDHAIFYAPNALVVNWIKNKYKEKLTHLFEVKTGNKVTVTITLKNIKERTKTKKVVENKQTSSLLNPSYLFDNFMVGGSNQFAYAAVKSVKKLLLDPLFVREKLDIIDQQYITLAIFLLKSLHCFVLHMADKIV